MSTTTKVVREEVTQPDGSVKIIESTITYAKVKKSVLHRSQLAPFGLAKEEDNSLVTGREKPIEIRCYPPVVATATTDDVADSTTTDQLLEQIQTAPRCKLCGMEGHYSLKCPKRKEIDVAPVKVNDAPQEITILVTDISDMTTEPEFQDLVRQSCDQINDQLRHQIQNYRPVRSFKASMPRNYEGTGYRGIAYINIPFSTDGQAFAEGLVGKLDGAKLGMVLIHASIQADRGAKKKGPNRYDDEAKWGQMNGNRW